MNIRRLASSAVALAVVVSTLIAAGQFRAPYRWHERVTPGAWRWWMSPLEWNVDGGLPDFSALNTIQLFARGLWVAGDGGLLAVSTDEGRTWTRLTYDEATGEFTLPPITTAAPPDVPQTALRRLLFPPLFAASLSDDQQAPPGAQKRPPITQEQPPATVQQTGPPQPTTLRPAELVASEQRFEFGEVPTGASKRGVLRIKNAGSIFAKPAYRFTNSGSHFLVTTTSCEAGLVPGQECVMYLRFAPEAPGEEETILLWENLGIEMTGVGVQPPEKVQPPPQQSAPKPASATDTSKPTPVPPIVASASRPRPAPDLRAFVNCDGFTCAIWTRDDNEAVLTTNGGQTWRIRPSTPGLRANLLSDPRLNRPPVTPIDATGAAGQSQTLWIVAADGAIARTDDNGRTWTPITRAAAIALPGHDSAERLSVYGRFLPPWYLAFIALCLGFVLSPKFRAGKDPAIDNTKPAPSAEDATPIESIAGNQGTADKPLASGEPDALQLGTIATGLSFFLRNDKTRPPLVLAINGRWGSGKSSLMNLLKENLENYGSRPVWFNAWHHQKEEQLLAALLQSVKRQAVPPAFRWSGVVFRMRLGLDRLRRRWAQWAIVAGLLVLAWMAEQRLRAAGMSILTLARALGLDADLKLPAITGEITRWLEGSSLLTTLTGLIAIVRGSFRGLRAFGSDPSSLLAADSGGTSPRSLRAQTDFRQQFAAEFADVTRALGAQRRMLILIDDLDRCRPEKVREVLEAVNFLISSGTCFIVLGMAREMVEHCVGLSFSRVVDRMPWQTLDVSRAEINQALAQVGASLASRTTAATPPKYVKRRIYARLFLDKLIQIEVSVPEPTSAQKRQLFESPDADRERNEARVQRSLRFAARAFEVVAPVAQAVVLAVVVVSIGVAIGRRIELTAPPPVAGAPATAADAQATGGVGAAPAARPTAASNQPPNVPANIPRTLPRRPARLVASTAAAPSGWFGLWPFYAASLWMLLIAATALRRLPQQIVRDSATFTAALRIWHPLVLTAGARNTPRMARRFQNRVRYLAMRQRALAMTPPLSPGERLVRSVLRAPIEKPPAPLVLPKEQTLCAGFENDVEKISSFLRSGVDGNTDLAQVTYTPHGVTIVPNRSFIDEPTLHALAMGHVYIPEPTLVALAAIHEFEPSWIANVDEFRQFVVDVGGAHTTTSPDGLTLEAVRRDNKAAALHAAVMRHREQWGQWHNLQDYRRAYMRLCSDVDRSPTRVDDEPIIET